MQPQLWIEVQRQEKVIYCQGCRRALVHESVMAAGVELEGVAAASAQRITEQSIAA